MTTPPKGFDLAYGTALVESMADFQSKASLFIANKLDKEILKDLTPGAIIQHDYATDSIRIRNNPNQEEKMSKTYYKLRNGLIAEIAGSGFGKLIESGKKCAWLPADARDAFYFRGGVMGEEFDAVSIVPTPATASRYQYVSPNQTKENDMSENQDGFVSIDYYNGYPIKDLSDERIFDLIRTEQEHLKTLDKLPTGAATNAHQDRINGNIEKLVAAVNARHA